MPRLRVLALLLLGICLAAPGRALASDAIEAEVDLLELHLGAGPGHLVFESTYSFGSSANRLVVKADGGSDTRPGFDELQAHALYSRHLGSGVALLAGGRHDVREGADLTYAAVGVEATLTPWLSGEHYFYLSEQGDLTGSAMVIMDLPLTARLRLEPRVTLGWSARGIPAEATGSGVTDLVASVRLRRSIGPHFDVYGGVVRERLLGGTADIARALDDPVRITRGILGAGFRF